jgi:hypothetical protein
VSRRAGLSGTGLGQIASQYVRRRQAADDHAAPVAQGQLRRIAQQRVLGIAARAPAASATTASSTSRWDKIDLYEKTGIGGMISLNPFDGSGRTVVARGVRNSVGMDINPKDKTVWFTDTRPTAWATTRRPAS